MSFVFLVTFIVVVVVMQTAFAHVRSSTSVQEQANAEVLEAFKFHQESILAQIPKQVIASTETKEARLKALKLAGAKDISVETFEDGAGKIYTSGWAYNVTKTTKDCDSEKVQFITAMPLTCSSGVNGGGDDYSYSFSCNVDSKKKTFEYGTGFWMGSSNCNNFETKPNEMISSGVGKTCNVDRKKYGVSSGCGENNFIRPAKTAKDSSVMNLFFNSMDACTDMKPYFVTAYPLNGCMQAFDSKGKETSGGISFTDCTESGSLSVRHYKSPDCKGVYKAMTLNSDKMFGTVGQTCTAGKEFVNRFVCNKPMK